jgi:alkanesulfonate monooxygenase SsuD/methylene tetrahydromethanopterin reductase-like flavin-dependent oxidoreductase (luciferase family)
VDGRLTRLVKAIDRFVAANRARQMAGFVVLLGENDEEARAKLAELAKSEGIALPLTIALEGPKGPVDYRLDPAAPITVLLSRRDVVMANFALADPPPKDEAALKAECDRILTRAAKVLSAR